MFKFLDPDCYEALLTLSVSPPPAGKKLSKKEDLKEMGDISSGMSSSIMQLYLKQVLEAFFHTQSNVRHFALNVIALTLNQGLIHPVQVHTHTTHTHTHTHTLANQPTSPPDVEAPVHITGGLPRQTQPSH